MFHYISTSEVYLPWKDTWLELPPLPDIDPGHRMEFTRIFTLNTGGNGLRLYLLGGDYAQARGGGRYTRRVWMLNWNPSNSSYYWTTEWVMGELHYPYLTTPTYRSLLYSW